MISLNCSFVWLVMSANKVDARIIDKNSLLWGSLSYYDKLRKSEGTVVNLLIGGAEVPYIVVKQGMANFDKDFENLKKDLSIQPTSANVNLMESNGATSQHERAELLPQPHSSSSSSQLPLNDDTVSVTVILMSFKIILKIWLLSS